MFTLFFYVNPLLQLTHCFTSRNIFTVTKWENNHQIPDISALIDLSYAFQVTLDQLVGNQIYHEDLLKEFKRIYSSKEKSFDEDVVELIEYLMTHPNFKTQIYRMKKLPMRKQLSLHTTFEVLIEQMEKI